MADYQIVCVDRGAPHGHITHVGISGLPGVWTVSQVRGSMSRGNAFYTVSPSARTAASVEPCDVIHLGQTIETIRSGVDAVADNNLDNLQSCRAR